MKNKNSGFSLFTVLIAVAFLSIMGLLLLYISVANFQIQTTDLKGKDSFYTAEQAIEEIRTGLQQDIGEAMSEAYLSVMENYSDAESVTDESQDDVRYVAFTEEYLNLLTAALSETTAATATPTPTSATATKKYSIAHLEGYVDIKDTLSASETLVITNPTGTEPEMDVDTEDGVLLKNIKVIYRDARGRSSIIQTDIRLGIPNIEFPTPSTLPDLMNMIVVADGGIECVKNTDGNGTVTINGSVYAGSNTEGVSILVDTNQALEINSGDQVVCEGEIKIKNGSTFQVGTDVNLWASGITLSEATVKLLGKAYIADDLTVESGTGSNVTISGEYYGYGSPDSARASHNNYNTATQTDRDTTKNETGVLDAVSDASLSSSIIINGKNTTLDLSGLTKLMLAGNSYVGGSSVTGHESTVTAEEETVTHTHLNNGGSDVLMGESLTVKGTQIAYLLPSSLLDINNYSGTLTNPMSETQYRDSGIEASYEAGDYSFVNMTDTVSEWGNRSLTDIGVDTGAPVKAVFYADNSAGGCYVYFYLNFTGDDAEAKAADFMQIYYDSENNSEVANLLNEYLSFYFPNSGSGITMVSSDNYLLYITGGNYLINGNILTYAGGDSGAGSGDLLDRSDDETRNSLFETQKGYQNMWYTLNRKMIGSYDLLNSSVKASDGTEDHNETRADQSVYDNLVNENAMLEFIYNNGTLDAEGTQCYKFTDTESGLSALFADNGSEPHSVTVKSGDAESEEKCTGSGKTLTIETDDANLRLVVCTGDVLIKSGVNFQGIIMTEGKITLEAGASLTSTPIEAAKVFQAQITSANIAPRDFFWDGEDYVLGNSTDSSDSSGSSASETDTYDISDAITYENWKKM